MAVGYLYAHITTIPTYIVTTYNLIYHLKWRRSR